MSLRKSISNTFTVTTLVDGESAPYYFEEKYAWSNDSSTQSVTTPPSISGGWQTSIPPSNGYAYLWRMSIRHVWNESTRSYTQEAAQYFRMSGTNGTSIHIKGHVSTVQNLPTTHVDGDAYVVDANGHLYMWSDESGSWVDIGVFQGEAGKTYYTHIAWASQVNYSGTTVTSVDGFITVKSPNDTTHMWMGVYIDEQSGQDETNALRYTWSYTKGDKGYDAVTYGFVFTEAFAKADASKTITGNIKGYAYKYVGDTRTPLANTIIRYGYIIDDSGTYAETTTNANGFFDAENWFNGDNIDDYAKGSPSIFAAIQIGGVIVHVEYITISLQGDTGGRGKTGRFYYYAQEWSDDPSVSYAVTDAEAPYFLYNNNYWVFNPTNNGTYTMSEMGTPSSSSENWKLMVTDFKYLITEAIFGSYAHFGSFIINGDWMISQHGTINGQASTNYAAFDTSHPFDDVGTNFIPNFAVDGLTGKTYQNNSIVRGAIVAKLMYAPTKKITTANYTINPASEAYSTFLRENPTSSTWTTLPKASLWDGLEISLFIRKSTDEDLTEIYHRIGLAEGDSIYFSTGYFAHNFGTHTQAEIHVLKEYLPMRNTESALRIFTNNFYRFKSMFGAWWALDGMFTGE